MMRASQATFKLGIDFAGGTEALISVPKNMEVSEDELKKLASDFGLTEPEVVNYEFEGDDARKGFFVRSVTQRGLVVEKAPVIKSGIERAVGASLITWDDASNTFTVAGAASAALEKALAAPSAEGPFSALAKAGKITVKESTFTTTADQKSAVIAAVGQAVIKIWDTKDESGERIRVQFSQRVSRSKLIEAVNSVDMSSLSVSAENEKRNPVFAISSDDSARLKSDLLTYFGAKAKSDKERGLIGVQRFEKVGKTAGQQLRNKGVLAVIYALIFILFYIALRFDPRYSPGAIVALLHDVSITLGIFCLLGREFNLPIIAALLAIVGYSLNDTIVVYDRIRENQDESPESASFKGIINGSINDCLSRTILTSVTTFIAVLAIQIYGGGIIENFAFAMLVGVAAGTYSSIYIASPLVLWMDNYFERREQRNAEVEKALS